MFAYYPMRPLQARITRNISLVEDVIVKGNSYTIKSGDTLSTIAKEKYDGHGEQAYYMKIYHGNPDKLTMGADHINANDVIIIPE